MNSYKIYSRGQYLMVEIDKVYNGAIERPTEGLKQPPQPPQNSIFAIPLNSTITYIKDSDPKSKGEIVSILCVYNNVTLCSINRYYDEMLYTGQLPITSTVSFENLDDIDRIVIENEVLPEKYSEREENRFNFNDEDRDFESIIEIFNSFTNVNVMQPKEKL